VRLTWRGALGLTLAAACYPGPKPPEPLNPVRFLLINDVYVADTLSDGSGGLARVATVRNRRPIRARSFSSSRAISSVPASSASTMAGARWWRR
jgi:hypothetical protein